MQDYNRIRELIIQIDGLGALDVYDGSTWFTYMSMELKHESLALMVTTMGDYFTHEVLEITDVKGFRAHSDSSREKVKDGAVKCKHCGENPTETSDEAAFWEVIGWLATAIGAILGFYVFFG